MMSQRASQALDLVVKVLAELRPAPLLAGERAQQRVGGRHTPRGGRCVVLQRLLLPDRRVEARLWGRTHVCTIFSTCEDVKSMG